MSTEIVVMLVLGAATFLVALLQLVVKLIELNRR
ncbi:MULTISPECIES: putative holin-like toxin [unclassified Novosphingobium]